MVNGSSGELQRAERMLRSKQSNLLSPWFILRAAGDNMAMLVLCFRTIFFILE